jgi:hypothetical protein
MRCRERFATPAESLEIAEASGHDFGLSQSYAFGEALARAYPEFLYEPRIAEFDDRCRLFFPLTRVRRRPSFLRCFEAMPLSLPGCPIVAEGSLTADHVAAFLETLHPDLLSIVAGAVATEDVRRALGACSALGQDHHATHVLRLSADFETLWRTRFSGKVRNQCRTASKKGVTVRAADGPEGFDTYYALYEESSRRWGYSRPPYPRELFHALSTLAQRGVRLKLAYVGDQAAAGILLLQGRRSMLYWSGAMRKDFAAYSPNNALLAAAIREACAEGLQAFDFGSSGRLTSVQHFKESFGAESVSYPIFHLASRRYRAIQTMKSMAGWPWRRSA